MGSDNRDAYHVSGACEFQSTLPAWGATTITINTNIFNGNFNPRSPHGERHQMMFENKEKY